MQALNWLVHNFGWFFAIVFLLYVFLILRRFVALYDGLRVPGEDAVSLSRGLDGLTPLFDRLRRQAPSGVGQEAIIDAIWAEFERSVSQHQQALSGYVNVLVLTGFAGTICGAIGAFREMIKGLGAGEPATDAFLASWNNGLATALYTSLGAAAIGAVVITLLSSRWVQGRSKMLEKNLSLAIADILEEEAHETQAPLAVIAR